MQYPVNRSTHAIAAAEKQIGKLGKPLAPKVWDLIMPAARKLVNDGFTCVACGQDTTGLARATNAALATVKAELNS